MTIGSDSPRAAAHAAIEEERQKIVAILALPEGKGECRPLAEHLAIHHSNLDLEIVGGILAAARQDAARAIPASSSTEPAGNDPESWGAGWTWDEDHGFVASQPDLDTGTDPEGYEASRLAGAGLGGSPPRRARN